MRRHSRCLSLVFALLTAIGRASAAEDAISVEKAWELLPQYQYGQDIAALLVIDQQVISAMASPDARAECAATLAGILERPETTPAARQYVCMQLRQVGTSAQVPVLARLLDDGETGENARLALESIPGEPSLQALREALQRRSGRLLIGTIHSLATRRDAGSVSSLQQLTEDKDPQVAAAALWALGSIANAEASDFLLDRAKNAAVPTPMELAVPLLRCAEAEESPADAARSIYDFLNQADQPMGIRRAAMEGLMRLADDRPSTVQAWFAGENAELRLIAAGHLSELSEQQLDQLVAQLADLPEASQFALLEFTAPRRGQGLLPIARELAGSDRPALRAAGLRCLGMLGDVSTIPLLIDALEAGGLVTEVAQQSLTRLPRPEVGAALLKALEERIAIRVPVIGVLTELKYYEAIDPLIKLASSADATVYEPALNGLRSIADPDEHDVPRLVTLLLTTPAGRHRDEVERTITVVCEKMPAGSDRAEPVLAALEGIPSAEKPQYLPLLGRLGGPKARQIIEVSLKSDQPPARQAAVRALCNWPTAEVAGQLWELASSPGNSPQRQSALRAYVRVVSLPSDRPEAETLAMLQKAMGLANSAEDKRLIISRAANVRTIETVAWLAPFLDDPELDQAACQALVELAHHRFLRHPNMDRFGPLLEKVGQISRDAEVRERATKYRLGL